MIASFIIIIPENAEAVNPTITKSGILPSFGDAGEVFTYFMTYTDADNDSPTAGYPKATKFGYTWPYFTFVANDSGDTNYADGKAYYYIYNYYPVIGASLWYFKVASNSSSEVLKLVTQTVILPSTSNLFGITPISEIAGNFSIYFNYTSAWQWAPGYVHLIIDDIEYDMIANDSDPDYRDGKMYHYNLTLNASIHVFNIKWRESPMAYEERSIGIHWLILHDEPEEVDYNRFYIALIVIILLCVLALIIFSSRKK
jgi:hypothetical protein